MSSVNPPDGAPSAPAKPGLGFFDLPVEVRKEIFSHCSQGDLICLSLVSKAFRELAAAQLYRNFHIVFPDEDDPSYDCPIDGLAGGLDTFVTSDYDYAQHLRDLMLDTLSAGVKAETAYKHYLYSVSCGKFLNTLLLLTLKKARSLEAFRWNIRVELSRQVYQALHEIQTLKTLHLRLQAGPTLYEPPPPLPLPGTSSLAPSIAHLPDVVPPPPAPPAFTQQQFSITAGTQVFYVAPSSLPPPSPIQPPKHVPKHKPQRRTSPSRKEPPTLSGFKELRAISVLDIDSLDIIPELKACVQNSARTLTKLQLSFSDYLGSQARKPPPALDPDDSDPDDDFQVPPVPAVSGFNDDASGPARAFRAQEERKSQEAVLGRIFDVEPFVVKKSSIKAAKQKESEDKADGASSNPGQKFINALAEVSRRLMKEINQSGGLTSANQDLLDLIEDAARKYVDSEDNWASASRTNKAGESSSSSPNFEDEDGVHDGETAPDVSLFESSSPKTKDIQKEENPDDIDIEEPLEQLSLDPQEPTASEVLQSEMTESLDSVSEKPAAVPHKSPPSGTSGIDPNSSDLPGINKAVSNLEAQKNNFKTLADKSKDFEKVAQELQDEIKDLLKTGGPAAIERLNEAEKQMQELSKNIKDSLQEISVVEAEIAAAEKQTRQHLPLTQSAVDATSAQERRMTEYLRSTRGLALETLSIYLIPVKASVLHKAVDLRCLRRITLLNVGAQGPIWTLFHKENRESPLPLRKIFTDNVSIAFLNFVKSLDEVHDLFMLERGEMFKPESFAPKTNATISHIRRLALKKHMHHLQKLMIKNQADSSWDLDEKTFAGLCKRGLCLEELACSTTIKAMHIFMRRMSSLVKLRALHIISLRNDDTCVWVMRETKEFLLDNLSHHPEMKLEWISIDEDDRVDRILMPSELESSVKKKKKKAKKAKGKQKVAATNLSINGGNSSFPVFPPPDSWDADSDSDEDDEEDSMTAVDRMPGIKFYDVWDVKIFKKEVVHGRL